MPSPACQVKDGAGAYVSTTDGVNVTPTNTITINLISSAGVNVWEISCITTDDQNSASSINSQLGASFNNAAKTATFTAPSAGGALRFQSRINSGVGPDGVSVAAYTTTFCVYTLVSGRRVIAVDETFEGSSTFGWTVPLNNFIRNPLSLGAGGASGDVQKNNGSGGLAASSINDDGTHVTFSEPRHGNNTPYASEGRAAFAMADANQTIPASSYSRAIINTTGALTAIRTATMPSVATVDGVYTKIWENACTGFDLTVTTGAGATVNLRPGYTYVLTFTTGGVRIDGAYGTFPDAILEIVDDADDTKRAQFQCSGISTATTRTFTFPNASGTFACIDVAQTFTAIPTFNTNVRFGNNNIAYWRNAANSTDLVGMYLNGSNDLVLGDSTNPGNTYLFAGAAGYIVANATTHQLKNLAGSTIWAQLDSSGLQLLQNLPLIAAGTSYVALGTTPATTGALRFANNVGAYWRNAANGANYLGLNINGSNDLMVGDAGNAGSLYVKAGTGGDLVRQATTHKWKDQSGANQIAQWTATQFDFTPNGGFGLALSTTDFRVALPICGNQSASKPFQCKIASITQSSTADTTLTAAQYECPGLHITGTPGGNFNVIAPNVAGAAIYVVNLTANQCTVKRSGGASGAIVAASSARWVMLTVTEYY